MKVATVHDALNQYGGAERILEQIKAIYPDAPIMVPIYDPGRIPPHYGKWDVRASGLNRMPLARSKHRLMLPLYPNACKAWTSTGSTL